MLPVAIVYAGFVTICIALIAAIRPIRLLRLGSRKRAMFALAIGVALVVAGMVMPARELLVTKPRTQLDQFMPAYQFHETHAIRIDAPAARVYQSIQDVTAGEIRFFKLLTTIRRFGRPGPESIINAPERVPILELATRTTFVSLAAEPNREILVGTVVMAPVSAVPRPPGTAIAFKGITQPGFAVATMNFLLTPIDSTHTHLTTETRVYATDAATRRRFARYWRVIYPGSALIRRSWLRAVRSRASA
ncbi:MAG: hypothetical protein ACT4P6_04995 [Gemmatimonadaceae bacterium]